MSEKSSENPKSDGGPSDTSFLRFARFVRLFGLWSPGVVFLLFLAFVPLTTIRVPMSWPEDPPDGITRGLFVGLSANNLIWLGFTLLGACFSWLFVFGLNVEGVLRLYTPPGEKVELLQSEGGVTVSPWTGYLPRWAEKHFSVPLGRPQLITGVALTLPGTLVGFAQRSDEASAFASLLALLLGFALAAGVLFVAALLMVLASYPNDGIDRKALATRLLANRAPQGKPLRWRRLRRIRDWLAFPIFRASGATEDKNKRDPEAPPGDVTLHLDHFAATAAAFSLFLTLLVLNCVLNPKGIGWTASSGALLFLIVAIMIWVVGFMQYHLASLRISPFLLLLVGMLLGYRVFGTEHVYRAPAAEEQGKGAQRVAPLAVIDARKTLDPSVPTVDTERSKNLVIVVATGGGIWAAGFTTLVLEHLYGDIPELDRELRVISAVSGGAVGTAFYVNERVSCSNANHPRYKPHPLAQQCTAAEAAARARVKATASSLEAVTYGLAFRDLPRWLTFGLFGWVASEDRGTYLEDSWCRLGQSPVAGEPAAKCEVEPSLGELADYVEQGLIPLPILNTTALETGRRVMATPLQFEERPPNSYYERDFRALTLDEYLYSTRQRADVSLWTAARLAATFPYVSPAVVSSNAALIERDKCTNQDAPGCGSAHHMIDGGYYDNYGVASALDWLHHALRPKDSSPPKLDNVAIVEVRAFADQPPHSVGAASAAWAALLGPLQGVLNIRNGAARQRNDIDIDRTLDALQAMYKQTRFGTMLFQPSTSDRADPLNWRMTPQDIERLNNEAWASSSQRGSGEKKTTDLCGRTPPDVPNLEPVSNDAELERLKQFLRCPPMSKGSL